MPLRAHLQSGLSPGLCFVQDQKCRSHAHPPAKRIAQRCDVHSKFGNEHNATAPPMWQLLKNTACAVALAATLAVSAPSSPAMSDTLSLTEAASSRIDDAYPVLDLAHIIPSGRLEAYLTQLKSLEADTGWRVRVLSRFGGQEGNPDVEEIRSGWHVDDKTIVVLVDPSAPSIMSFKFGLAVQRILPRPFFTEVQSRYGNIFYIRDNGEAAAVDQALNVLDVCLRKGGCTVPPGLPQEQYLFTLGTSVAGGLLLGAVLRIEPQGFVQRRWVWGLLFFPLWGTLSINFGLGPIITRTDDLMPVAANIAATIASALLIYFYPQAAAAAGLSMDQSDSDSDF